MPISLFSVFKPKKAAVGRRSTIFLQNKLYFHFSYDILKTMEQDDTLSDPVSASDGEPVKTKGCEIGKAPEKGPENGHDKQNKLLEFLLNIVRGAAIGVAFIIPGFSGGSVAAILGVYEKLVGSVADLFKHFKTSVAFLFPILIGLILGVAALILPIQWGLGHFPIPTVSLFVGLALGGLPSVTQKVKGKPKWTHIVACLIPLAVAASLCFLPTASQPEGFLLGLNFGGYLLLILIGAVGACALVVPGISGSMLLLIFGYYTPLVQLLTEHLLVGQDVGVSLLVFLCAGIGVVGGFFGVSVLMKYLLRKFPRGTYFAIIGFIVGSIPAVYASVVRDTGTALLSNPWYIVAAVALLLVGAAISFTLVMVARKKGKKDGPNAEQ